MNNLEYYEYSKAFPEKPFDVFYKKNKIVLPKNATEDNELTINDKKLVNLITTFKTVFEKGYTIKDDIILDLVDNVVDILHKTKNINYSAFSQFFMVYNTTHSYFLKLPSKDKRAFIYHMLIKYCQERHDMYCEFGYTSTILQVICDNYSHKRNSKTTIDKILNMLKPYELKHISKLLETDDDDYYFLPDKGNSNLFDQFLIKYNLTMGSRKIEQNKYPDLVFKHNGEIYICELKTMKGIGGGQNKQVVEFINFINYSENNNNIHYLSFLDGDYSNRLFTLNSAKIKNQRKDLELALKLNPNNYFVNTAGMKKLISNIFN